MHDDRERCLRAVQAKDARFDGWFFTAVTSTRIYCRPSCPVVAPRPEHMVFYPSSAAAQQAGFRACKRCRPDATPGSPEWNGRADAVARAMRLINDGVIDREGVGGLAGRLGYSVRQVERIVTAELGAGPLALARAQRGQTARVLIETTDLPMADVAFAAGFASVRSFNATVAEIFALSPTELRRRARHRPTTAPGTVGLRLALRTPFLPDNLFGHLAATAVPGVEEWRDGWFRRTLRLAGGPAVMALAPRTDHVACQLALTDLADLPVAVNRARRLLDLDADPVAVDAALGADPRLAPLVAAAPGRRVPHSVDGEEMALRAVLGQQVSTSAARTHTARLVAGHGTPLAAPDGTLTHLFPTAADLLDVDPATLALPDARRRAVLGLLAAVAAGGVDLSPGADWDRARAQLAALPGIGPWTVETIAMRALADPDAFPAGDLGVRRAAAGLGLAGPGDKALQQHAAVWRPWRSYAVQHLWATGTHAINRLPGRSPTVDPTVDPTEDPTKELS